MEITNDPAQADAVIVNTCSFIDAAQEESVDTILESAEVREAQHRGQALIVSGCLPQRFREELPKLLPEVDAFMGIDQVTRVARHRARSPRPATGTSCSETPSVKRPKLESKRSRGRAGRHWTAATRRGRTDDLPMPARHGEVRQNQDWSPAPPVPLQIPGRTRCSKSTPARPSFPDYATPRFRLTPRHFAYVKIAEGCNHPCSFCIIPRMRGTHRSRPQADVVAEAGAARRRRQGTEPDLAGLDLLRAGPAPEP